MLATSSKLLLKNALAHTTVHNKGCEEREMWRQWELERKRNRPFLQDTYYDEDERGGGDDYRINRKNKAFASHMYSDTSFPNGPLPFTKALQSLESADPMRWGHEGYEELYPEQFGSESPHNSPSNRKRKKLSRSKQPTKKKKHRNSRPEGDAKKRKRRKHKRNRPSHKTEELVPRKRRHKTEKKGSDDSSLDSPSPSDSGESSIESSEGNFKRLKKRRRLTHEDVAVESALSNESASGGNVSHDSDAKPKRQKKKHKHSSRKRKSHRKHKRRKDN